MVHTTLAALHVPSVRQELRHQHPKSSQSLAAASSIRIQSRSIAVPYPVGAATLQISGVHLRLMDIAQAAAELRATQATSAAAAAAAVASTSAASSSSANREAPRAGSGFQFFGGGAGSSPRKEATPKRAPKPVAAAPAAPAVVEVEESATTTTPQGPPLAINVVVRVQVQPASAVAGATSEADAAHQTREFVAAVVPLQLGAVPTGTAAASTHTHHQDAGSVKKHTADGAPSAVSKDESKTFPAPFRPVKKGPRPPKGTAPGSAPAATSSQALRAIVEDAPVSGSAFVKLDLRLQVERVRFIVEVCPGIPTAPHGGSSQHNNNNARGRRPRDEADEDGAAHGKRTSDAALEVVIVGAVSPLV